MGHANVSQPQPYRSLLTQPSVLDVRVHAHSMWPVCVIRAWGSATVLDTLWCVMPPSAQAVPERDPQATQPCISFSCPPLTRLLWSLKQKHSVSPCVMPVCVCDCRWSAISTGRAVEQKHTAWFKCPCWIQWNWPPTASEPSLSIRSVCVYR